MQRLLDDVGSVLLLLLLDSKCRLLSIAGGWLLLLLLLMLLLGWALYANVPMLLSGQASAGRRSRRGTGFVLVAL
jgi:hypothetical protein